MTLDQAGWQRASVVMLPPPAPLADLVDFFWSDERHRLPLVDHRWRVVADDAAHVIYGRFRNADGTNGHRLHVVGARRQFADIDCSRRLLTVGARLRPGALPALFGVPSHELTDLSVPVDQFVRPYGADVLAQLDGVSADRATSLIESFIGQLAARGSALDVRARWLGAVQPRGTVTVRDVAEQFGVGERSLRSWSATQIGIGYRRFLSIRRLHRALETRLANPALTWSRIAALTGFADQPHFVRDCRALLGESPGEFVARQRKRETGNGERETGIL